MNESMHVKPAAANGAAADMAKTTAQAKASADDNKDAAADPSGFNSVFASYMQSEPASGDKNMNDGLEEMLAELFPDGLPEDGKQLPDGTDDAMIWQAYAQLLPAENAAVNKDGVAMQAQGISLLDPKAKATPDAMPLTTGFIAFSEPDADDKITALTQGGETKNLIAKLAALQVDPAKKDAVLFNLGDQIASSQQHATNSTLTTSLSALGAASTSAPGTPAAPQTHMAPLNMTQAGWESNLASRLQMLVGQHSQQADIRLDPPDLGSLDVKIKIVNDTATVSFTSPHHHVRDAIESAVPRLREMFADSGLSLGDVNVRQESFAQQQNSSGEQGSSSPNAFSSFAPDDERHDIARKIVSNNLLDTYA